MNYILFQYWIKKIVYIDYQVTVHVKARNTKTALGLTVPTFQTTKARPLQELLKLILSIAFLKLFRDVILQSMVGVKSDHPLLILGCSLISLLRYLNNVLTAKFPFGEISLQRNILRRNFWSRKHFAKCQF